MRELTMTLGVTAALLHGVAYVLYNRQAKIGQSTPNPASWGTWAFISIINALTFRGMSGDWVLALQFFTGSVACVLTFVYVFTIGRFSMLKPIDRFGLILGFFATFVWAVLRDATGANMIVVVAMAIGFIPTYYGVWRDPQKETPRSWVLWTLAFLVTTVNVIVNWKGQPLSLVMPIGGAILHGGIAVLSTKSRKEKFRIARGE